jgi:capsule polysaccharide modification protein KpsS
MGNVEFGIPVLLKRLTDELNKRQCRCFYFTIPNGKGIDGDEELYHKLEINAVRFDLIKDKSMKYNEYQLYSKVEMNDMIKLNRELELMKNGLDKTEIYKHEVRSYLECIREADERYRIDMFIVWSMRFRERIIYQYARKHNIPIYIFEHGYFRPFTLTVDTEGINFENSLPRSSEFYLNQIIDEERLKKYLNAPETAIKDARITENYKKICESHSRTKQVKSIPKLSPYISNLSISSLVKIARRAKNKYINQPLTHKRVNYHLNAYNQLSEQMISSGGQYIFVPFQLQTDTQTVLYSPYIKTMLQLVTFMSEAVAEYNDKYQTNLNIVFKPHPMYQIKEPNLNLLDILEVCKKFKNCYMNTSLSTTTLIKDCEFVATINSTVGIEALTQGKKVMTLGQAFYNIDGIVEHVKTPDQLLDGIYRTIHKPRNQTLVNRFLYYIRFNYFSEIFYLHPDAASVERLVNRILNNYETVKQATNLRGE